MGERRIAVKPKPAPRISANIRLNGWRRELREFVIRRGMKAMCGTADFVPTSVADDIPLVSGGMRFAWLKALGAVGVKDFVAVSGLGYRFVCHVGDLAEYPFYHRRAYARELALSAAWLESEERPVVYDLGANVGFISTHLAQILEDRSPRIYAFEPVPLTFEKLVRSVRRLGLNDRVHPIAAAVVDELREVRIAWSPGNSMLSQVVPEAPGIRHSNGFRHANGFAHATGITIDAFSARTGTHPTLVKMDVEGSEVAALRGARRLLAADDRPAIIFEHNPATLAECGATSAALAELLAGYAFFYVDDFDGQKRPFGSAIESLGSVDWACNIFAAPERQATEERWRSVLKRARTRLSGGSS
jgi:FkbM family methyltransferase